MSSATPKIKIEVKERADREVQKLRYDRAAAQRKIIRSMMKGGKKGPRGGVGQSIASGSYATERGGTTGKGRLRDSVSPRGGSADWHLDYQQLSLLRRDAQQAMRKTPLARMIVKTLIRFVWGKGPRLTPQTSDKGFNGRKAALWEAWWTSDFPAAQRLGYTGSRRDWGFDARGLAGGDAVGRQALRAACTDGDIILGFNAAGQITATEAERIVTPFGPGVQARFVPGEGGWVNGIEYDAAGRAVRAAIAPYSPDLGFVRFGVSQVSYADLTDGSSFFFRNPLDEAVNQTRGEPALAAILPDLDKLEDFDEAVLEAAATHAKITAVATSNRPGAVFGENMPGFTVANAENTSATGATNQEQRIMEAGLLLDLGTGSDVKFPPPGQPGPQYGEFVLLRWGMVAADVGVPILLALMDPREANYSGFRAAIALAQENFDLWRGELARMVRWMETQKTAQWIREGLLDFPEAAAAADGSIQGGPQEWAVPSNVVWNPMPVLDPAKEVAAGVAAILGGIKSRDEVTRELTGRTAEQVDTERAVEKAREEKLGLAAPSMMGQQPAADSGGTDQGGNAKPSEGGAKGAKAKSGMGGRMAPHLNGTVS